MKKWIILVLLFHFVSSTAQERGFTLWNKNVVSVSPWEKISLDVAEKIHYSTKTSSIGSKYGEIILDYEAKKWLNVGLGFRHTKRNLQNENWIGENRPMILLNLSHLIDQYELSFSNRFEYRSFKSLTDYFRYRQALTFDFPNLTEWGMQFYVSEESFLKLNGDRTHLVRLYTGLKTIEQEHFIMKLYYSLEKSEVLSQWLTNDIVGINFSFSI